MWNTQTGEHVQVLRGWDFESCAVAVDAGSNEIFVGGNNSSVVMFNMTTGEIKIRFNANSRPYKQNDSLPRLKSIGFSRSK